MTAFHHSVTLDEEKCVGCTHCMGRCPTEAIRVRDGKARILTERCIDCGVCVRVCPHHAKRVICDDISRLAEFEYTIALPAPTLYGQFAKLAQIDYVLTALLEIGFDDVFEVSRGAEIASEMTRILLRHGDVPQPLISSACPAVARLIQVSFPALCNHVLPMQAPMHISARMAKEEAMEETGLPEEKIGVFFISPCPAKVTDVKDPIGIDQCWVDGVLSISDLYPLLLDAMKKIDTPKPLGQSGLIGVSWANSGGEASSLLCEKYLAADGMENILSVLEEMDGGTKLQSLEFAELNACPGGCVGGVLSVENAYVAKTRIQRLRKYLPVSYNHANMDDMEQLGWQRNLKYSNVLEYSSDIEEAMEIMEQIDDLADALPGLDCGSCGAPSCRALAEDIVIRGAQKNDCVFVLREEARTAGISVSQDLLTQQWLESAENK